MSSSVPAGFATIKPCASSYKLSASNAPAGTIFASRTHVGEGSYPATRAFIPATETPLPALAVGATFNTVHADAGHAPCGVWTVIPAPPNAQRVNKIDFAPNGSAAAPASSLAAPAPAAAPSPLVIPARRGVRHLVSVAPAPAPAAPAPAKPARKVAAK
jgi:hypothetical protein